MTDAEMSNANWQVLRAKLSAEQRAYKSPFPSDDEWEDSPYAQYVGMGVDEEEDSRILPCGCDSRYSHEPYCDIAEHVSPWDDHDRLSYRLSYWFWLHFYRLQRRLGLMK